MNLVARGQQCLHRRTTIGLDPDHDLIGPAVVDLFTDLRVQPDNTSHPFFRLSLDQRPAGLVLHFHIMVVSAPVVPHQQHEQS